MIKAFEFQEDGRTYSCTVEKRRTPAAEAWWWFGVSGDGHRYAPFQAAKSDTQDTVRTRIVTYYKEHLVRKAMPAVTRQHWASRGKGVAVTAATPAAAPTRAEERRV